MSHSPIRLSVAIITYNEERNMERCLRSVQPVADEIVVVDSFSTDRTKEVCLTAGVRFIEHAFAGYVEQKNFALDQVSYDYVLSLDADEALSEELQRSIIEIKKDCRFDAYRFNRLTNYCGQWIRHCGWYPDTKTRLWKRSAGRWSGENIHESVHLSSEAMVGQRRGNILHYSYYSIEDHVTQINKFSSISAREYEKKGKSLNPLFHLTVYPFFTFLSRYIFRLGFLDGPMGFVVCKNTAYFKYLKYVKLYELKKRG